MHKYRYKNNKIIKKLTYIKHSKYKNMKYANS